MAMYYQRNIPSPAKLFSFTLQNFVGGLNNRDQIPLENQCTDVVNMAFTQDGLMEKRKGTEAFDEIKLDGAVTWIDQFKPHKEEDVLVRATTEKLYIGSALVRNVSGQVHGVNHMGKYFFCDNGGLWVYGRFDETAGTHIEIIGTQTVDYVLMQVVTPTEGYTPLAKPNTEGKRVINFNDRTVQYQPCEYEIEDTFKQGNVIPEKPRFIVQREGRLYLAGSDKDDDNVFISDVSNPYYFPASLPMQLPPNSDRISGLAVYNDAIIVGRRLDMHAISGDTNRTDAGLPVFKLQMLNSHFGFASQRSVVNAHNYLFFLGTDGQFYVLKTAYQTQDTIATQVISKTVDVHSYPVNASKDDLWYASAVFHDDNYYCTLGDKILVYNYLHQAWTVYDQIEASSLYVLFTELLMGGKDGQIVIHSKDYTDRGKPFKGLWRTRWFDMDDANAYKMFKDFFIVARSTKEYVSNVHMKFEVDYQDSDFDHDVSTNYSIYGKSKWGDRYINRDITQSLPFMIYRRGRKIRITFWNSDNPVDVESFADLSLLPNQYIDMIAYVKDEELYYTLEQEGWRVLETEEYNQGMCVLQLSGEYEFKWKR